MISILNLQILLKNSQKTILQNTINQNLKRNNKKSKYHNLKVKMQIINFNLLR